MAACGKRSQNFTHKRIIINDSFEGFNDSLKLQIESVNNSG